MGYRWLLLLSVCFGLVSCANVPRLVGLEDWRSPDFSSETRQFREDILSPFVLTPSGNKIANPEHILRASGLLELSCIDLTGNTTSLISVEGYFYDHLGDESPQTLARKAKAAILPLDVVADFHKLKLTCDTGTSKVISLCTNLADGDCAHQIGTSSWLELQSRFANEYVPSLLRPRPDPVLQPFDEIRVSRKRVADVDDNLIGLVDSWLLEVNEDGLLPLPMPGISPADGGTDFEFRRERAWLSSAAPSMYALEVSTGSNCPASGVRLSTVQACLSWAGRLELGLSTNKQTPSMKARFAACEKLGIDERYRPADEQLLNSWSLEIENQVAALIVEDGRRFTLPVGDGATLVPAVRQAYKQATGRELLRGSSGSRSVVYLTVQPRAGTCRQHAAPFFIRIEKASDDQQAPIRLFRGDTVHVSRRQPREAKTD